MGCRWADWGPRPSRSAATGRFENCACRTIGWAPWTRPALPCLGWTKLASFPPRWHTTFLSVHARTSSGKAAGRLLQLNTPRGLQPVAGLTYTGRFPFVEIGYKDAGLPCQVRLEAFSPFVPQDAASSSLPVVFFSVRLRNPGPERLTAVAAISWKNDIVPEVVPEIPGGSYEQGAGPGAGVETRSSETMSRPC